MVPGYAYYVRIRKQRRRCNGYLLVRTVSCCRGSWVAPRSVRFPEILFARTKAGATAISLGCDAPNIVACGTQLQPTARNGSASNHRASPWESTAAVPGSGSGAAARRRAGEGNGSSRERTARGTPEIKQPQRTSSSPPPTFSVPRAPLLRHHHRQLRRDSSIRRECKCRAREQRQQEHR